MAHKILKIFVVVLSVGLIAVWAPKPAYAIDKRLKLAMKTGGYGAAAGAVIGAATIALGYGGYRNILMGASSGLYAGLLFAAYIIATPNESEFRPGQNPYRPRKPINSDDYEDSSEDELKNYLPPKKDGAHLLFQTQGLLLAQVDRERGLKGQREVGVWAPLLSLQW